MQTEQYKEKLLADEARRRDEQLTPEERHRNLMMQRAYHEKQRSLEN
jgi:hypothetical protein